MPALYVSGLPHELKDEFRRYFEAKLAPKIWRVTVTPSSPMWACLEVTQPYDENVVRSLLLNAMHEVAVWALNQPAMRIDHWGTVKFTVSITPAKLTISTYAVADR